MFVLEITTAVPFTPMKSDVSRLRLRSKPHIHLHNLEFPASLPTLARGQLIKMDHLIESYAETCTLQVHSADPKEIIRKKMYLL